MSPTGAPAAAAAPTRPEPTSPEETSPVSGPTLRAGLRHYRGPLAVLAALVVAGTLLAVAGATTPAGVLAPDSYAPRGARAVAQVLQQQGVPVTTVPDVPAALAASSPDTTLLVTNPALLARSELAALADAPGALVVIGAQDGDLAALDLPATVASTVEVTARRPACALPAAVRAGTAEVGGLLYRTDAPAVGCYATGGAAAVLVLTGRDATLLGSGDFLTNDAVDEQGNAALALNLLGARAGGVVWLVPRADRPLPTDERGSLRALVPDGVYLGALQLAIAAVVLALWRARRLGRVVVEPLPVVVRAAEAVEGRGRLYRLAEARETAAEALRAGTRDRLRRRLGVAAAAGREAVVATVAEHVRADPGEIDALLYGGTPPDDAGLTRLAAGLRRLQEDLRDA